MVRCCIANHGKYPAMIPIETICAAESIDRFTSDLIQKPITTAIAIVPIHQRSGVPRANTSRAQFFAPQSLGES